MENNQNQETGKANKGIVVLLVIIILVLGAVVGVMFSKLSDQEKKKIEVQEALEDQKAIKKILEDDLIDLQEKFGSLQTNNDSLKTLASEQQERISKLLAIQADNAYKIRTYQKELETLRTILKDLYYRVDSLNQQNIALKKEKDDLSKNLQAERVQTARLTEERQHLTTTVQKAQVLSVADIQTIGLNNKGKDTPRARNIDKLKTCFTVRENLVTAAGERVFYLVIINPAKKSLTNKNNDFFTMQEGNEIVYTDKRTMDYENKDIEVCIFSDNNGRLTDGKYEVRIYCEGYLVGTSTFVLK